MLFEKGWHRSMTRVPHSRHEICARTSCYFYRRRYATFVVDGRDKSWQADDLFCPWQIHSLSDDSLVLLWYTKNIIKECHNQSWETGRQTASQQGDGQFGDFAGKHFLLLKV